MLRALVLVLVLANVVFFAWARGWLGTSAHDEREPRRLEQQVRPGAVRVLAPRAATAALAATPACVEAGPFGAAEVAAAEQALAAALPPGAWTRVTRDRPGRWVVYMGRFPNVEGLERKRNELRQLQVNAAPLVGQPEYEPGLVLSSHGSRTAADEALDALVQRGVGGARVLTLATPATQVLLRIERGDPELRARALALQAPALGAGFSACAGR
jgi:hypothetical protein